MGGPLPGCRAGPAGCSTIWPATSFAWLSATAGWSALRTVKSLFVKLQPSKWQRKWTIRLKKKEKGALASQTDLAQRVNAPKKAKTIRKGYRSEDELHKSSYRTRVYKILFRSQRSKFGPLLGATQASRLFDVLENVADFLSKMAPHQSCGYPEDLMHCLRPTE